MQWDLSFYSISVYEIQFYDIFLCHKKESGTMLWHALLRKVLLCSRWERLEETNCDKLAWFASLNCNSCSAKDAYVKDIKMILWESENIKISHSKKKKTRLVAINPVNKNWPAYSCSTCVCVRVNFFHSFTFPPVKPCMFKHVSLSSSALSQNGSVQHRGYN